MRLGQPTLPPSARLARLINPDGGKTLQHSSSSCRRLSMSSACALHASARCNGLILPSATTRTHRGEKRDPVCLLGVNHSVVSLRKELPEPPLNCQKAPAQLELIFFTYARHLFGVRITGTWNQNLLEIIRNWNLNHVVGSNPSYSRCFRRRMEK